LHTNSAALAENIGQLPEWRGAAACDLHVDVNTGDDAPVGPARFRGMHHAAVASFGAGNVFAFDLQRRCVCAKVSQRIGEDQEFWQRTMLPIMAGLLGPTIGLLALHSACLARDGDGVLIAGQSGAGKSTLAVALAQRNFDYISDDWTYCTMASGMLTAHGMAARVKLLPDAARHFPQLQHRTTHVSMNGEVAFEVHADEAFGARLQQRCRPRMLVFFERDADRTARFLPLDGAAARRYMEANVERLPVQLEWAGKIRSSLMDEIASLPCWKFTCGGEPGWIAQQLETFFEERRREWA